MPILYPLPYHPDSQALFERLADAPWAVFLDSGAHGARQGRFDILSAWPERCLLADETGIWQVDGHRRRRRQGGPFLARLRELLGTPRPLPGGLPFAGGLIGYLGYDFGFELDGFEARDKPGDAMPSAAFGLYRWAVVVDHQARRSHLVIESGARPGGRSPRALRNWLRGMRITRPGRKIGFPGPVTAELDTSAYRQRFERIQAYIRDGDVYQVNFAQRFEARCNGDSWTLYQRLRRMGSAPYAAYLHLPFADILSMSPELFVELRGRRILTKPIKGTRPRSDSEARDRRLREELLASEKDRAENLMIVDLLRNDLGRVAEIGSVRVPKLFALESFSNVHHLVSSITARLADDKDLFDLLEGSFPGGSITGAPKRRAMEIIDELEPRRRGLYCGAIGYIDRARDMAMNIAIRTMVRQDGSLWFWAGGGIVADSDCEEEGREIQHKAVHMLAVLKKVE